MRQIKMLIWLLGQVSALKQQPTETVFLSASEQNEFLLDEKSEDQHIENRTQSLMTTNAKLNSDPSDSCWDWVWFQRWSDRLILPNTRNQFSNQKLVSLPKTFHWCLKIFQMIQFFSKNFKVLRSPARFRKNRREGFDWIGTFYIWVLRMLCLLCLAKSALSRSDYNLDFLLSLPSLSESCHWLFSPNSYSSSSSFPVFLLHPPLHPSIFTFF